MRTFEKSAKAKSSFLHMFTIRILTSPCRCRFILRPARHRNLLTLRTFFVLIHLDIHEQIPFLIPVVVGKESFRWMDALHQRREPQGYLFVASSQFTEKVGQYFFPPSAFRFSIL